MHQSHLQFEISNKIASKSHCGASTARGSLPAANYFLLKPCPKFYLLDACCEIRTMNAFWNFLQMMIDCCLDTDYIILANNNKLIDDYDSVQGLIIV